MTTPARGYSWPPFESGNTAAQRHGAQSERHLRPLVDELLEALPEAAPWTSGVPFRPTVEAWAWAEAQAILYRRWFDEQGLDPVVLFPGQTELRGQVLVVHGDALAGFVAAAVHPAFVQLAPLTGPGLRRLVDVGIHGRGRGGRRWLARGGCWPRDR